MMKRFIFLLIFFISSVNAINIQQIEAEAKKYLGGKYVWGGSNPLKGMDCSGFVQYVFSKTNVSLPRTAWEQSKIGTTIAKDNLQKGDLLFFLTDRSRGIPVTHTGLYLGNGNFIHAAGKDKGIIISPLSDYSKTFVIAKRITKTPLEQINIQAVLSPYEKALMSSTKVAFTNDPFVMINEKYYRLSELQKINSKGKMNE